MRIDVLVELEEWMFVVYILEVKLFVMELLENLEGEGLVVVELYCDALCYLSY